MKLVSIRLEDVRRFVEPVRIDGIGAGLNLLCAPNEFGKSTLFDALQALFFQPHRSKGKEIAALEPHVGGAPTVTVEVDLPDGRHTLSKRWLSKPQATVHRGDTLVAQADAAEEFITRLVQTGGDGGPAGLLWVRQGLTGLEGEKGAEREAAKLARRNLMTSVTGEVEALTGGRRMDRALTRTREELGQYLTPGGKTATNGPLAKAQDEVEVLSARKASLEATAERLDRALTRRRAARRELLDLTAADAVEARKARLDEATERMEAARRHADSLTAAKAQMDAAELSHRTVAERLDTLRRARAECDQAQADATAAAARLATARAALTDANTALAPLADALAQARQAQIDADATWREALRADQSRAAATRRADLSRRLDIARDLTARRAPLARSAATGPQAQDIVALEALSQEVQVQRALRDRSAPQITFRHSGPQRVTRDGQAVADGPLPVLAEVRFEMPSLGSFTVTPGAAADHAALDKAEAGLAQALARLDQPSLDAARAAAAARAEADAALRDLDRQIKAVAADGLAALETELAALPEDTQPRADLPDVATAQHAADAARDRLAKAEAAHDAARTRAGDLRDAELRASVQAEAAAARASQTETSLAALDPDGQAEADLTARLADAATRRDAARAAHDALAHAAPDLPAVQAALTRARSVMDSAADSIRRLDAECAGLDVEIAHHSGDGVMEELADVTTRLTDATERLAALRFEVAVLQELAQALETARNEARDRYFEPVLAELRPLLRLLWPDAELRFDGESLLPTALVRGGREEDLSILSGGTQEQIALLVRLAFARLLARRGQHAPVIFDDALVFTDDDRIEKMFDALHSQAADQQIIVLSCRQRAFRDLGGAALAVQAG